MKSIPVVESPIGELHCRDRLTLAAIISERPFEPWSGRHLKTVFILGAGASQQAGAPLMFDFLDRARDLLRLKTPGVVQAQKELEDVFNAISDLQGVHSKSYLDLNNIEIVFGAIEMALLLRKLGTRDYKDVKKLRDSLITLIFKTLEHSIKFPVEQGHIVPPAPYKQFMEVLASALKNQPSQDPHEFAFITFNYDLCLDQALHFSGVRYDYFLNTPEKPSVVPLLKLHGSINWGQYQASPGELVIEPWPISQVNFNAVSHVPHVFYNLGSNMNGIGLGGGITLQGPPIIVPPTWNKDSYHGQLSNVWAAAAHQLSTAQNIIVIGYSLPETDSFFRYLYALGSESATQIRNFVVIDPDPTDKVFPRFRTLIGRGIESRFRPLRATFWDGLGTIRTILNS